MLTVDPQPEMGDAKDHLPLGLCYLAIGIVGCYGHLHLIRIFWRHCQRHVRNRNAYFLHANLAVAQLGVVIGFPFTAWSHVAGRWLFGDIGCQLYGFHGLFFGIASIYILCLMPIDRFYAVYDPYSYEDLTRRDYKHAVGISWLVSFIFAALPLFGIARYTKELSGASCAVNWYTPDSNYPAYILIVTTLSFVIPYIVMTLCLVWTTRARKEQPADHLYTDMLLSGQDLDMFPKILSLVSLIAWTPYALLCLQFVVRDPAQTSMLVAGLPPIFAKMAISVIPFIYGLSSNGMYLAFTQNKIPEKLN